MNTGPGIGPLPQPAPPQSARDITFHYEIRRSIASGVIETAGITFLMFIALKIYNASPLAKAFLAAGGSYGFLLTPLVVFVVARTQRRSTHVGAFLLALGGIGFLVAAMIPNVNVFLIGSIMGLVCSAATIPLFTQMYQDNYASTERGKLFSRAFSLRILVSMGFSFLGGLFLKHYLESYQFLLVIFALAFFVSAYCMKQCPSKPLNAEGHELPFKGLKYLRDDSLFRLTLISWMLMGTANLMMVFVRVEFLVNPKYGPPLDAATVALLTGVIPNAARFALSGVWGRLFDKMNFFALRILMNIGFALGGVVFFTARDMPSLVVGALVFGVANAGGDIAWSLWVTKLAPADRVAEYMSVHTFFTGLRSVLAPHIAFYFLTHYSFHALSILCAMLILFASGILVPEMRAAQGRAPLPPE